MGDRVKLLKEMDGCNLLDVMCHSYEFQSLGAGLCLAESGLPPTWKASPLSSAVCEQVCNEHVSCAGASYQAGSQACYLAMKLKPTTNGPWSSVDAGAMALPVSANTFPVTKTNADATYTCAKKASPEVKSQASSLATTLAWLSAVFALCASLALCCTCSLLFTTSTRKKGKKGAMPLLHKLFCPCCVGQDRRRYGDEEEGEDEEAQE